MSLKLNLIIKQLIEDVPGDTYQGKLDHLSNCNCCKRHQINKPSIFTIWQETEFHNEQKQHSCMCNCRHVARFICRQCHDYETHPIIHFITPHSDIDKFSTSIDRGCGDGSTLQLKLVQFLVGNLLSYLCCRCFLHLCGRCFLHLKKYYVNNSIK